VPSDHSIFSIGPAPLGVSIWNLHTAEIIQEMESRGIGLDSVLKAAPHDGFAVVSVYTDSDTALFLGCFANGRSRWWISCILPGARPGDVRSQQAMHALTETTPSVVILDSLTGTGKARTQRHGNN